MAHAWSRSAGGVSSEWLGGSVDSATARKTLEKFRSDKFLLRSLAISTNSENWTLQLAMLGFQANQIEFIYSAVHIHPHIP